MSDVQWYDDRGEVADLVAYMLRDLWDGSEVVRAVEAPWKYESVRDDMLIERDGGDPRTVTALRSLK